MVKFPIFKISFAVKLMWRENEMVEMDPLHHPALWLLAAWPPLCLCVILSGISWRSD